MTKQRIPYKLNAPGDFYVESNECITCTMPELEAPSLIGSDESGGDHCFFKRQPRSVEEENLAIDALDVSCCGALRYSGKNKRIIRILVERNLADRID